MLPFEDQTFTLSKGLVLWNASSLTDEVNTWGKSKKPDKRKSLI